MRQHAGDERKPQGIEAEAPTDIDAVFPANIDFMKMLYHAHLSIPAQR